MDKSASPQKHEEGKRNRKRQRASLEEGEQNERSIESVSDTESVPNGNPDLSRESSDMIAKKESGVGSAVHPRAECGFSSVTEEGGILSEPRRFKQPTLAVYGLLADPKKEIADRDVQIEDLKEKLSRCESEVQHRESHFSYVKDELDRLKEKLQHFRSAMRCEMLRTAKQQKAEVRRLLHQRHFELGQIVTWSGSGKELWMEGNLYRDLSSQLEEVRKRRDEVESLKKAAHSSLKQISRVEKEEQSFSSETAVMEAQEELQLRTAEYAALTNVLGSIEAQKGDLENKKKAFLKEIRRISDEDASEFIGVPSFGEDGRYILMRLLGKGGFSEVWQAFDLEEGRYVACKVHRVQSDWTSQTKTHYIRHAERELSIMRQVHHPHVTQLYDVFEYSNSMFVSVMEFSHGMDLDTYLKTYRTLREADARLILLQMVGALRYLASMEQPIIHYDLKPANILLHSDDPSVLEIKITDFGLSKIISQSRGPSDNPSIELTSQGTGTYWYQPPECFVTSTTPLISNKVDVWSLGVMFFQMLFGRRPFAEGQSQRDIWQQKLILSSAGTLSFPEVPKVSDEARELITKCLAFNVADRCDIFQLSQDPYLYRPLKKIGKPKTTGQVSPHGLPSPKAS